MKNIPELKNCISRIIAGELSVRLASKICGYSQVHIRNMIKKYKIFGDAVFIHHNTGKKPATTIPANTRKKIVSIYRERFDGYNFTFFSEMLKELYNINFSDRTVYNILSEAGIKSPENRKEKKKEIHRIRPRRQCEGELLQIDATPYQWFKWSGDTTYYALHGSIDDATGKLTALYMCENECLYGYAELIRRTFYDFKGGHPEAVYSDRAAIFCKTQKKDLTIEEQLRGLKEPKTQWQRMLNELNVKQILAWSPQAKGRCERMWRTIQGRLPWYFEHYKIKTMQDANIFLLEYINIFNRNFAVEPASPIKVWHKTYKNPDYVLCSRISRRTTYAGYFSFEGYKWEMIAPKKAHLEIELCISDRGIQAYYNGKFYNVRLLDDDFVGTKTQVLDNIIFKYLKRDMKEVA
ncbi:MAG: ISNCY family transposase [Treponema sp.]|nr:ISNCY family transposase [Treponema sp.]